MAISKLIDEVKVGAKYLTVATANIARLDFVLNWRESIRRNINPSCYVS
jgi:hypothetical protein